MREVKQAMARENTARGARTRRRAEEEGGTPIGDVRSDDSGKGSPRKEGNDEESNAKRKRLKVGFFLGSNPTPDSLKVLVLIQLWSM